MKYEKKICEINEVHEDVVKAVLKQMPSTEILREVSSFFKCLSNETRVKIICALGLGEMCVCDLATLFNMSHSAVSHQLSILRRSRIVKYRKSGKIVYYSLDDKHVSLMLLSTLEHVNE